MGRTPNTMAPALTSNQFDLVYNLLSLGLASMAASTVFFFLRLGSFAERYRAALCFTGLVTFIAMYHYFRIFNSFTESYTPCEATPSPTSSPSAVLATSCTALAWPSPSSRWTAAPRRRPRPSPAPPKHQSYHRERTDAAQEAYMPAVAAHAR